MRRLIEAVVQERVVLALILVNTAAVFLRGFASVRASFEHALFLVDYACTLYFCTELGMKLWLRGPRRYLAVGWNRFDLAVVLVSCPMLLSPFLELESFAAVLVLRLARVARFLRLLRFVPDSERIWSGVKRGLKASLGVGLALSLYCFALALAACHLFGEAAPERFGDPFVSFFSLFQVFTVEGWQEIAEDVAQALPGEGVGFARGFFMVAVLTGGVLGLSLANAVFIDEMVMDNTNGIEASLAELRAELADLRAAQERSLAHIEALLAVHTPPDEHAQR